MKRSLTSLTITEIQINSPCDIPIRRVKQKENTPQHQYQMLANADKDGKKQSFKRHWYKYKTAKIQPDIFF